MIKIPCFSFKRSIFAVGLLFFYAISLLGQTTKRQSIYDYLTAEEGVKLTIETDFTSLIANRKTTDYQAAMITTDDGKAFEAQVKPRGKYRRKICEVPPIKIKFSKKMLLAAGFDTLNEIKLVVPCFDDVRGEKLIVKEYIAYRMFERLTAASVRARIIKVTLKDNHVEATKRQMLCLLVEDEEETCARLRGNELEVYGIEPDSLLMNQAALVAVFQYMIGNTDWDISMMRNIRLIQSRETGKVLLLPYDFDFSGFVSAPYASPSSDSGLLTVRDRFLMADGIDEESLKRAVQIIRSAKKDLLDLCKNKYISKESSNEMIFFLESYYQRIGEGDTVPGTMQYPTD